MSRRFLVLASRAEVAEAAADRVVAAARNAIRRRGSFRIALPGGSTPGAAYALLAQAPRVRRVDWSQVEFFWGDERAVPPDHPESNFGMAWRLLLSHLPGLRSNALHRMPADETDLEAAAAAYQRQMARAFGIAPGAARPPALDLVWLGVGRDGHTASLFPGAAALGERRRWVVATAAPPPQPARLTLTFPVINVARAVLVVATGSDKAPVLRAIRSGAEQVPAARIRTGRSLWLLDTLAADGGSMP